MFTKLVTALAICTAAITSGCVVVDDDGSSGTGTSYGTLTSRWSLDSSIDADACAYYQIDRAEVAVYDDNGYSAAEAVPFCETFGVSFDLRPGWYSAEITLLDMDGFAVSDTVITDVRVIRDTEVFVDANFPDSGIF